jgi:hypothetical protein
MAKARYEGYFEGTPTKLVKEIFGDAKVYTQNANLASIYRISKNVCKCLISFCD